MKLPRDIGPVHFVGIGGIGMSGIAEVMVNLGYAVQGSDQAESANVKRLREKGCRSQLGIQPRISTALHVVVVSSAIKPDNPELVSARAQRLPVVRRAEMLAELMRLKSCVAIAGTHGKTTTTSMVAALLDAGGFDPTVINGGIINAYGTNARLGAGDWMVVEADESDGTFLKLPADIAIVTNIDPEHLDHFKTFDAVQDAFAHVCRECAVLRLRGDVHRSSGGANAWSAASRTAASSPTAKIPRPMCGWSMSRTPAELRCSAFCSATATGHFRARDQECRAADAGTAQRAQRNGGDRGRPRARRQRRCYQEGLANFGGVRRRFTRTGMWNGVTIIDDYGHHPVEIAAVLKAARESTKGQVIAVVQPHRYTRLAALFEQFCTCFNDADAVIVAHVYPAGEAPIEGADRDALVQGLRTHGHRHVIALDGPDKLARAGRGNGAGRATMSSASAPVRSRNGPMRCRENWRRLKLDPQRQAVFRRSCFTKQMRDDQNLPGGSSRRV